METFPIVRRNDERVHDRTKRLILARYKAMAEAEAAGREYKRRSTRHGRTLGPPINLRR